MKIKYSLNHPEAKEPVKATDGSLAFDLYAATIAVTDKYIEYDTGVSFEFPEEWGAMVHSRSSVSKKDLVLANGTGIIDSDFRQTVKLRFKPVGQNYIGAVDKYSVGDRIGQIIFNKFPKVELERVSEVKTTESREGGFGSTGQRDVLNGQQKEDQSENSEEGIE